MASGSGRRAKPGEKMKTFAAIISVLIAASLLFQAYATYQDMKQKSLAEAPLPVEEFRTFLTAYTGGPVELLAWSKPAESCQVLIKRVHPESGKVIGQPVDFMKMHNSTGSQWYCVDQGAYIGIDQFKAPKEAVKETPKAAAK